MAYDYGIKGGAALGGSLLGGVGTAVESLHQEALKKLMAQQQNTQAPPPPSIGAIDEEFWHLIERLNCLEQSVYLLRHKMQPILTPPPNECGDQANNTPEPPISEVARALKELARRVNVIHSEVENIYHRIEL